MRDLAKVGTLSEGARFVTPLTRRLGTVLCNPGPDGGVVVSLAGIGEQAGENELFGAALVGERELHPDVRVEVVS